MARGHFNQFADTTREIARKMRAETEPETANNRRHGRIRPDAIWCSLGTILDLSASGLRVMSKKPLGGQGVVTMRDGDVTVSVQARIVWCRRIGFRRHEAGIEFVDIRPEEAARLRSMAVA